MNDDQPLGMDDAEKIYKSYYRAKPIAMAIGAAIDGGHIMDIAFAITVIEYQLERDFKGYEHIKRIAEKSFEAIRQAHNIDGDNDDHN